MGHQSMPQHSMPKAMEGPIHQRHRNLTFQNVRIANSRTEPPTDHHNRSSWDQRRPPMRRPSANGQVMRIIGARTTPLQSRSLRSIGNIIAHQDQAGAHLIVVR